MSTPGSLRLGKIFANGRPRSISAGDGSLASTGVARMFRSASCMSLDFFSVALMYRTYLSARPLLRA